MADDCEHIHVLISGYLDGELDEKQKEQVDVHVASCEGCRKEFDEMRLLVKASSQLRLQQPPDEAWDDFENNVYNRLERKTGWLVFILGAVALAVVGIYLFVTEDWGSAAIKLLVAAPVIGLVVVFISVLRERIRSSKTDRYSKEVKL